ncbi:hypothetical protein Tco_1155909 [Tanacetum coccineum]
MQIPLGLGSLPSNTVANPGGDVKAITTRSGVAYDGLTIPTGLLPSPKEGNVKTELQRTRHHIVVDYDVDPRVPLILRRPFLRTTRALIDVHGEEMTLRVNDEAITFKVRHTSRYSRNYYDETVHQVNVIDVTCEEYVMSIVFQRIK